MNRSSIAILAGLVGASLAGAAAADLADITTDASPCPMQANPRAAQELRTHVRRPGTATHLPNDTTWVGFNPAYAASNYWSIGVGHRRPRGAYGPGKGDIPPVPDDDTGYWDWEHPVHGDSLQGWWPIRHLYTTFAIAGQNDKLRPWHAVDIGNQISYTINQGAGFKRTFGVTGAWHVDAGRNEKTPDPAPIKSDVNPKPPRWTPIAGNSSAWCGLRAHGDIARIDAVTGNPYNVDALEEVSAGSPTQSVAPGWTNRRFPGYAGQWDQMLYRDVNIAGANAASNVAVTFSYRTRMSTGKGTTSTQRTGWFDKDPLAVVAGNFISSSDAGNGAPIDSFMVYVGQPVGDAAGSTWTGSDGASHQVFDPVRRWFGELIRANDAGGYYELFTTYGNRPPINAPADSNAFVAGQVATRAVTYGALRTAWGNTIRLVFRIKTNRGAGTGALSDDGDGSVVGAYNSGYLGAAQLDDVSINLGGGPVSLGGFEAQSEIDNDTAVPALNAWKTSSKPPAIYFHVRGLSDLTYQDLCGGPGAPSRICNMAGNVISMGNYDLGEAASGPFNSAEQEHFQGIFSPTINLAHDPGSPTAKNNMGLDADTAVPTQEFAMAYDIYTGYMDLFNLGQAWRWFFQSYPAVQSDGTRMWGEIRTPRCEEFDPTKECFDGVWGSSQHGMVRTSNPSGVPDSIRIGLLKLSQCYRFGISVNCGSTLGGYIDNMSLAIIDAPTPPLTANLWEFWNDTFPANETTGLPGTSAFDTTAALIKTGLNMAQFTGDLTRYDVPGDTTVVDAAGDSAEVQLVFRILPGPGNYKLVGDLCGGLRRVPADTSRITPGDDAFWTEYILNPGKSPGAFPTTGPCKGGGALRHDQRWSELVWCTARCDTAEQNLFPIQVRSIGGPSPGHYASMYHESDKHLAALGIARRKCFLVDTLGVIDYTNITCSAVPAWVTAGGVPYKTGYDGSATTVEGTKILPDGLLTPGSHVEYFYEKKDLRTGSIAMCPDTTLVYPQASEGSLDAHRWQEFSVLPDAWKFSSYGGLGKACMLYVDWDDRGGDEGVWVSIADSIGATVAARRGAHNGWSAPGGADVNDPAYFVNKNGQPGTTWDMYGVKAAESLNSSSGSLGARLAYRGVGTLLTSKVAKNAPSPEMLGAYYRILMILTGDLNSTLIGPFDDRSQDDTGILHGFLAEATAEAHRGLFMQGDGLIEDMQFSCNNSNYGQCQLLAEMNVSLRDPSYLLLSGNKAFCVDLIPTPVITTNGDIYGLRNTCLFTLDVLNTEADGVAASNYGAVGGGAPYVAGVFADAEPVFNPDRHFQTLVEGWGISRLSSRLCDTATGRLAYYWKLFSSVFGKICTVVGTGPMTVEVPNNDDGRPFVNLAGVGNNPLRQGSAVIHLELAQADRVTVRIYDVSGRLVRTLADGQLFKAGRVDPALTWDGLDDGGRAVGRGIYFASVRYQNSRYEAARKMIVLK
ncbi:MAG TPA: FlgD immunoglobulin-like domain containing protein [Candidatus Eisenbacteria bacterium]|jgi:hypothetical protein